MRHELKTALDKVRAEPALVERTADYLRGQARRRSATRQRAFLRAAAVATACLLLVFAGGAVYLAPAYYIDLDVNPSIELVVNRLGRVASAHAYNDDASPLVQSGSVRNRPYADAVEALLDEMIRSGQLAADGLVSVTVQAPGDSEDLLRALEEVVADALSAHHIEAELEVYGVSQAVKTSAHAHHMSPARYIAITQLQEVDDTASYEGCAGHSISQIRRRTAAHGGEAGTPHHGRHGAGHAR